MSRRLLCEILALGTLVMLSMSQLSNVRGSQDIGVYERIGQQVVEQAEVLESEYPPLSTAFFAVVEKNIFGLPFAEMWLLILVGITAVLSITLAPLPVASAVLAAVLFLSPDVVFARFDIYIFFLLLLVWQLHEKRRYLWSGIALALAVHLKLVPLLLVPGALLLTARPMRWKMLDGLVIGAFLGFVPLLLFAGFNGIESNIDYLRSYHGTRGIQIESLYSSLDLVSRSIMGIKAETGFEALSLQNMSLAGMMVHVATAAVLTAIAALTVLSVMARKRPSFATFFTSGILLILAFSPILSPQYLVWALPLVALMLVPHFTGHHPIAPRAAIASAITLFVALATQWVFPTHYGDVIDQSSALTLSILLLRNLALPLLAIALLALDDVIFQSLRSLIPKVKLSTRKLAAIMGCLGVLLLLGFSGTKPYVTNVTYQFENHDEQQGSMPLFVPTEGETMLVDLTMVLSHPVPHRLRIKPDDCIDSLYVNDMEVVDAAFCDYGIGQDVNLWSVLQAGENHFVFRLRDEGGLAGVNILPALSDPVHILLVLGTLLFVAGCGLLLLRTRIFSGRNALVWVMVLGAVVRILYVQVTPYYERGHDTEAHIDYIQYMAEHLQIPPASEEWEYHQAPLYYAMTGLWMRFEQALGTTEGMILAHLQMFSLLLSFVIVLATGFMALTLFPKRDDTGKAALFAAVVLTIPSLVFIAARISNDMLSTTIFFVALALLLAWWKSGSLRTWYILCITIAIGCLTKTSAYVLIPMAFLCFLVRPGLPLRKRLLHCVASGVLTLLLFGWLPIHRLNEEDPTRTLTLGNDGMSSELLVENSPRNLLTFNPLGVLQKPFNNPWTDDTRRRQFPEYFFRSAFTGEFEFPSPLLSINILMLTCAMLLLPILAIGFLTGLIRRPLQELPLLLCTVLLLAAAVSYRISFPYAPNQDFRFSVLLLVPFSFFLLQGAHALRRFAPLARGLIVTLCVLCTIFFVLLALQPR